uniref:Uncharacterized protein n=1 Tax=Anguilla anguilla TaxID=7936 RepID=A0A0E9S2M3_ANGAN
MEKFTDFLFH